MLIAMAVVSLLMLIGLGFMVVIEMKKISAIKDDFSKIRKSLALKRLVGWGAIILGVANLLDAEYPFPIPLVGAPAIYMSVLCIIAGSVILIMYFRPKIDEMLTLAEKTGGYITLIAAMRKLGISQGLVEKTIRQMLRDKLIIVLNTDKEQLADLIFLVRSFSGNIPEQQAEPAAAQANNAGTQNSNGGSADEHIRRQHQNVTDMGVGELNERLLFGTLDLGHSGRPTHRR